MKASTPYQLLNYWKKRIFLLKALAFLVLIAVVLLSYFNGLLLLPTTIGALAIGAVSIHLLHQKESIDLTDALHLAHAQNSKIEYSGQLLLGGTNLSGIALLQKRMAEEQFSSVNYRLPWDSNLIKKSLLLISAVTIGAVAIQQLATSSVTKKSLSTQSTPPSELLPIENIEQLDTAFISAMNITSAPPAYTGLKVNRHKTKDLTIVEGSKVTWNIDVAGQSDHLYFKFSEGDTIKVLNNNQYSKSFTESDFYTYGFKGKQNSFASDFHSIKVVADKKPNINITGIEEYVRLPWHSKQSISFDIKMSDDYGLTEAFISATVAKGSGEAVKFRERKFELQNYQSGKRDYSGSYSFDPEELEMEPGDELYFYVKAKDNYPYADHWTKSITYFVSIQDTTTYEYTEDSGMQVDLMPDFFRSQRQIIIDTEQLLANRSSISKDSFNRASNILGFDQKMLRLKYGQFLGEENESGIAMNNEIEEEGHDHHDHDHNDHHGHEHEKASPALQGARNLLSQYMHDHDHEEEEGLLMSTKGTEAKSTKDPARPTWVEELSHNHDDSEVATFHDVSVKSKLRAALSVMWDAELHLRLYDPAASLPFQNESLLLLQEIKNHARIYVHRIGFDPPAIKDEETRLSGDQDEIEGRISTHERDHQDAYMALEEYIASVSSGLNDNITSTFIYNTKDRLASVVASLAQLSLQRPDILPVLSLANRINSNYSESTIQDLNDLRIQMIKILPEAALPVTASNRFAHETTLTVAKKMSF